MAWDSTADAPRRNWQWSPGKAHANTPRDEMLSVEKIIEVVGGIDGKSVLDLGVGRGACLKMVPNSSVRVGVDSSANALEVASIAVPGMIPILSDARSVPLEDCISTIVWSHGVVEHFKPGDIEEYVREAVRLSSEWVAFSAPNPNCEVYKEFKKIRLDNETWEWGYEEPLDSYAELLSREGCEIVFDGTTGSDWETVSIYGRHSKHWREWKRKCDAGEMVGISTVVVARKLK